MPKKDKDLLREKCRLHNVDTTGCQTAAELRQALNDQAPQWEKEEDAPPPRRAAAEAGEKKRTSGEDGPSMETSSAKKPKAVKTLVAARLDADAPSKACLEACEQAIKDWAGEKVRKAEERITSKDVHLAVLDKYDVKGRKNYNHRRALADATLALAMRYEDLEGDEKKTSPLRWLDASNQFKKSGKRPEVVDAK